ncbi:MAG: hypothetical protein M1827_005562 [Pycnora praestabilis]|nr:MAG: hypothetical protein M1827_005562 [Pycnora praestabilis]
MILFDALLRLLSGVSFWSIIVATVVFYSTTLYIRKQREYRADKAFGAQHGCLPMETVLPYKWPLALDILKRQYDALPDQRLLAFQSPYIERMPNMELHLLGNVGYLTTDPKNVEAILHANFEDWGLGSRREGLYPLLGEGIFTQDGRAWKHSREMLRRQFARIDFKNLDTFDEHVSDLVTGLQGSTGVVDLQPAFFRFTLATTTALIFGEPVDDLEDEDRDTFASSFDYASMISAIRLRLADLHWLYTPKKFTKACENVKRYATHFVNKALSHKDGVNSSQSSEGIALILDLYQELGDPLLVRDQLVHVLIAGRDTTACTMSWVFFLLVRHPKILERLRSEIRSTVPNGEKLTRSHIQHMPYLKNVLNETLRLYPQLPFNIRVAVKTTILPIGGGPDGHHPVLIRKGTGVGYSVYHMHRRTDLYGPDATEFRPERWEGTELDHIGWGFMPFHGGPRICLGKEFALIEASYGIVRILQAFPNLRLPPEEPQEPTGQEKQSLTIVVSSAEGCRVLLS